MANEVIPYEALTTEMATAYQVTPQEFVATVKAQCFPNGAASNAQLMMLLSFAKTYDLNPLAKECYAFISGGRMSVGVQVDGWTKIKTRRPDFDGQEFVEEFDKDGNLVATKSITYVKGRTHPTTYRAVLKEWKRPTDVWNSMPAHQLFVKAHNQGVRFAFGIPAYDPDDVERMERGTIRVVIDEPKVETKPVGWINEQPSIETSASATSPTAGPPVAAAQGDSPAAVAPEPQSPCGHGAPCSLVAGCAQSLLEPEPEGKKLSPKAAREKLDKLISRHVPAARLNLMLGKLGKANVEALSDEEVTAMIAKIEKQAK